LTRSNGNHDQMVQKDGTKTGRSTDEKNLFDEGWLVDNGKGDFKSATLGQNYHTLGKDLGGSGYLRRTLQMTPALKKRENRNPGKKKRG